LVGRGAAQTSGPAAAATAIGVGVLSNTLLKMALALVLGRGRFRWIVAGTLLAMGAALVGTNALR
jgi:hypothetical protein